MATVGRLEFEKKLRRIDLTPYEFWLITFAYRQAKNGHGYGDKRRDGGERQFEHPKRVALILMDENADFMPPDPEMIIAALLHDIKEDCFILTWEDIERIFGKRIKKMVEILTKDKELGEELRNEIYFKKLAAASSKIKNIKLADRLDNVRTLGDCSPEKQKEYLSETINFYLPLAKKTNGLLYHLLKIECEKYTNKELP